MSASDSRVSEIRSIGAGESLRALTASQNLRSWGLATLVLWLSGCASFGVPSPFGDGLLRGERQSAYQKRANVAQIERLESEIRRLEFDLRRAELFLIAAESRLAGAHTRAEAVRIAAEARSLLEMLSRKAPWRAEEIQLARKSLTKSDEQLQNQHFGAAILIASRAKRVAAAIGEELERLRSAKNVRRIRVQRANLRRDPSTKSEVIEVLQKGGPVFPENRKGSWVLVQTSAGGIGWIKDTLLESIPASTGP